MKSIVPKNILIVEDDTALQMTLVETMRSLGYEVRAADGADEAIALAKEFRPTLVMCDVHLTRGDGRKVVTGLREDPELSDCQIVMMTGDWVGASQRDSIALEADAYLPKPFTLAEFLACVEEQFRQANL